LMYFLCFQYNLQDAASTAWYKIFPASGGEDFFHFCFVPKMYLSSSQWVPIRFQSVPQECSQ
jgi:hypothetical protein